MSTNIEIYREYVEIQKWIAETLSNRKNKKSKDQVIYLIEIVYCGFVKCHLHISKNKFLEQAAEEKFGRRLPELYQGLDEIEIQYFNCSLFHEKLNNYFNSMKKKALLNLTSEIFQGEKKSDTHPSIDLEEYL